MPALASFVALQDEWHAELREAHCQDEDEEIRAHIPGRRDIINPAVVERRWHLADTLGVAVGEEEGVEVEVVECALRT